MRVDAVEHISKRQHLSIGPSLGEKIYTKKLSPSFAVSYFYAYMMDKRSLLANTRNTAPKELKCTYMIFEDKLGQSH